MAKVNERKYLRFHELYKVVPQEDYTLKVLFMDGTLKIYDVKPLIAGEPLREGQPVPRCGDVPIFSAFNGNPELFNMAYVDLWRDQIIWDDMLDLPESIVWDKGITIDHTHWTVEDEGKANPTRVRCTIPMGRKDGDYLEAWMLPRDDEEPSIHVLCDGNVTHLMVADGSIVSGALPDDVLMKVRKYLRNRKQRRVLTKLWDRCVIPKPKFLEEAGQ